MPCRRARRGDRQVCRSLYDPRRAHPAHSLRLIHAVALYLTHSFPFSCAGRARFAFLFPQPSTARARPPPPPMAKKDLARFLGPARALIFVCTYPHARPTMQPILVCSPRRIFDSKTYIQASWITAPRATIVHQLISLPRPKSSCPSRPPCSAPRTARLAVRAPSPRG